MNVEDIIFKDRNSNLLLLKDIALKHVDDNNTFIRNIDASNNYIVLFAESIIIPYLRLNYNYVSKESFPDKNSDRLERSIETYLKTFKRNYNINKLLEI